MTYTNSRGMAWLGLSIVTATAMTIGVRMASVEMGSQMIVLLRCVGGLILAAAILAAAPRQRRGVRFSRPWAHAVRGLLIGISTQMGFYAITKMPLATASVLFFSAPIFTTLLAPLMLGEKVGPRRLAAVAAGFSGVLIIVRPGAIPLELAAVLAVGSSFLFALVLLMSRKVANADGAWAAYLSATALMLLVSIPLAAADTRLPVSGYAWFGMGLVAVTAVARNIADIQAYRYAEASLLAPLSYTRIILIAGAAYLLFGETPDIYTIAGGVVIIASALYIAQRERVVRRQNR